MLYLTILLLFCLNNGSTETHVPSLRFPIIAQNRILEVTTTCNATNMNITIHMEKPFKGLLAAKDFSQECKILGNHNNTIAINFPTSGCGVRMSANLTDNTLYYSVMLVAQQDKFLRQITDQEKMVRCRLKDNAMSLKSEPMFEALRTEVNHNDNKEYRTARMRNGWKGQRNEEMTGELLDKELENVLGAARAWMEISPLESNYNSDRVQVGEPTMLSVKSTLPAGIGWRVVDCTAHDGIGEVSQRLLDAVGCPLDTTILPALHITEPKLLGDKFNSVTAMRHQEALTSFPAFKFPDRDRLHVTCALQLCRGKCQQINCNTTDGISRVPRLMPKGEPGEILDRLEVFNSVEVLAPGIELDDPRNPDLVSAAWVNCARRSENSAGGPKSIGRLRCSYPPEMGQLRFAVKKIPDGKQQRFTPVLHIPGDRPFCVSPNKMAIAFCILGIVFLVAVIVALCSLMRARRNGNRMPYYTRSLFSSSSGGSGYGGSKLLLHESPSMGQTRHWRIL